MSDSFFDTNILLCIALQEESDATRVLDLIAGGGAISVQVLNEIANVSRKKHQKPWTEINGFLQLVGGLMTVVPVTMETHEHGLKLAQRYGFSIYDAMIVAAALLNGCGTLWSKDMHHGLLVEGKLRIIDPFRA
jgi:predicted nucleic acid-binding protein